LNTLVLLAGLSATAPVVAQEKPGVAQDQPAVVAEIKPQLRTALGTVKLVAADMVTVTDRDGKEWSFAVDTATKVVAKGAGHATAAARKAGETVALTDLIKDGQRLRIRYFERDGKLRASEIRVI
jgi:hypothetical protein